jgi:hypothetical protein
MEHNPPTSVRPVRIPPIIWLLGLGLIVALVAIFVFSVPLGTVGYYALITFFVGSHFFMHGSHGGHGGHGEDDRPNQARGAASEVDGLAPNAQRQDEQNKHAGGCH